MGILDSTMHLSTRKQPIPWKNQLRTLFDDGNPGWAGILAATGIALGNGVWFYQTSGYYPFYVLLAQRTLWFKQFFPADLPTLLNYFSGGLVQAWEGHLDLLGIERLLRLSAVLCLGILALQGLWPRWPESQRRMVPVYARVSLLAVLTLMFFSGQIHAITRYAMGNIFFVVLYLQYVYGTQNEPRLHHLPGIILRRKPGTFCAVLRLTMLLLGPALTFIVLRVGPQLGI